jgi:plastocyanin
MRFFRLLPAAVIAIALLVAPVEAVAHHRPGPRPHPRHAVHHRHLHAHGQLHAHAGNHGPNVNRLGSAVLALAPRARLTTAHAADDTTVTIADFQFTPATVTIHVGDTVTWINHGPSAHTATANNGSFNTGVLQKGHSASHTFTTAGTFSYICSIHPFMHGTVVVLANTTSTSTTPATTPTSTTPTTTSPAQSTANELPNTGLALTGTVVAGMLLAGLGLLVRKTLRA